MALNVQVRKDNDRLQCGVAVVIEILNRYHRILKVDNDGKIIPLVGKDDALKEMRDLIDEAIFGLNALEAGIDWGTMVLEKLEHMKN